MNRSRRNTSMVVNPSYKTRLVKAVRDTDEACYTKEAKAQILNDDELLEYTAIEFQKDYEDYGYDYGLALDDALAWLGIDLSQTMQPDKEGTVCDY